MTRLMLRVAFAGEFGDPEYELTGAPGERGAAASKSHFPSLILPSACCILLQSLGLKSQSSTSGRGPYRCVV